MNVSVIIPTYNEKDDIINCLNSLSDQTYRSLEVIVVDDGSTDSTIQKLNKQSNINYEFILLKQKHKGPGAARNLGAGRAGGEILVFVDADMTFDKNFLKDLVKPIIQGKLKGTFSKNEFVSNWDSVWARCWNINEGWDHMKRHPKDYPDKQKVFRAILKSEFDKVGGFTPGGYTDDYSLAEKLGYEAIVVSGAKFYHTNPDNLEEVYLQARWAAKRKYKYGLFGLLFALLRASVFVSVIVGFVKAVKYKRWQYLVFKIVYDAGIFVGALQFLLAGRQVK